MPRLTSLIAASLVLLLVGDAASEETSPPHSERPSAWNWHQWRGPDASGVAPHGDPPVTWSEDKNIRWKVPIEGRGTSTPIVWENRVFLVTAIDTGQVDADFVPPTGLPDNPFGITYPNTFHQYVVICLDLETGEEHWRRVAARRVPSEGHHGDNSFASASPTTDGTRLYVWFGSAGLHCYDLDGQLLWSRDLGAARTRLSFGEASSPVIHQDKLIVTRDQEDQSYIVVIDARSGETIWRADRDEPSGWSTPIVVAFGGTDQLITNGKNRVRSYNLSNGELLWQCGGQASNVTPSPVATSDTAYCMSGYRGSALYALPLDANGDISDSDSIRWSKDRATPYVPSPLLVDDLLYFTQSNNAILSCVLASTGEVLIDRKRLPGILRLYASPVAAAGRVYIAGRDGTTLVIRQGGEFEVIAENVLGEGTDASPAIVGKKLLIRGKTHLHCIAAPE